MADYSDRVRLYDRHASHHELSETKRRPRYPVSSKTYSITLTERQLKTIRRALYRERKRMRSDEGRYDRVVDECFWIFEKLK